MEEEAFGPWVIVAHDPHEGGPGTYVVGIFRSAVGAHEYASGLRSYFGPGGSASVMKMDDPIELTALGEQALGLS